MDLYRSLTDEQQERLRSCASLAEMHAVIKEEDIVLTEDYWEAINIIDIMRSRAGIGAFPLIRATTALTRQILSYLSRLHLYLHTASLMPDLTARFLTRFLP